MNSLLIFRFRALSIGSLLFLSSLRARDWKKEKKCGESLFAFAPLGEEREKKILRHARRREAKTEKKKSEERGERSKRFQTTNVFVGRLIAKKKKKKKIVII